MRPINLTTTDASGGTTTSAVAPMNTYGDPAVSLQLNITGTATCTVQATLSDVQDSTVTPVWVDHPSIAAATATVQGNYAFVPVAIRMQQTAGNGSAELIIVQAGTAAAF